MALVPTDTHPIDESYVETTKPQTDSKNSQSSTYYLTMMLDK